MYSPLLLNNHEALQELPGWDLCYYVPSKIGSVRRIIFIHGFNGDPLGTWSNYHALLPIEYSLGDADLFFYGYRSRTQGLDLSTQEFCKFVDFWANGSTDLVLVGHSLGGLIVRRCLVKAVIQKKSWVKKTTALLLAPAQAGARATQLVESAIGSNIICRLAMLSSRLSSTILDDIEPNAPAILALEQGVKECVTNGDRCVIPKVILVPRSDPVVLQRALFDDPDFTVLEGTTHSDISKADGSNDPRYVAVFGGL